MENSAAELLARHRAVLPSWMALNYEQPIEIASGKGCRVTDGEGREYLDFFAGILTNMLGYGVPEVTDAIHAAGRHRRAAHLHPVPASGRRWSWPSGSPRCRGSRTRRSSSPAAAPRPTRRRCCSPRRRVGRNQVLALRNSYHGRSFAAMGDHGQPGLVGVLAVPGERQLRA